MQIGSLNPATDIASGKVRQGEAVSRPERISETENKGARTASARHASAPLRRGLSNWDQQLNRELADAQQAMRFLEQSESQLESLKADISAKIAGRQMRDGQIAGKLRQFADTWNQRQMASGGSLDAQLQYSSPAPASQSFSIRGLNMRTLQSGDKETLTFAMGGTGRLLQSVVIDPALSEDEIVQRFAQAFAPADIRVGKDNAGALIFTLPESSWPATRDTIAVKGDGIRFPTGQFSRLKADAVSPALEPDEWQMQDIQALRQTSQRIVQALERIRMSREVVGRALSEATRRVDQAQPTVDTSGAETLAKAFVSISEQPSYQIFPITIAALLGMSRDRVLSLLALASR